MQNPESIRKQIDNLMVEINCYIDFLYISPYVYTRNLLLNQLRDRITMLNYLMNSIESQAQVPGINPASLGLNQTNQRTFTAEELAKYNGKDGNPAYLAVNGVVYDVTNNAAWAAATHFGLTAGKDLTKEFASCHAGQQQILSKLKTVGRLV